ncbi:MAG: peptidoglycan-binding protein [Oscillatoriaceae bacterium SKW80]|nr:peptidoglycan-binding protein [Oscillatoriaceae bacterium SKYG93]MCX8119866.1 peptidoglycan-binding protein [Oscillatoriaceae bacterium SKW80]MDW8452028.1 peptidoglycan-binding protein [Oscillatoriaceae cyanobacterium SKYGB_i_bin93]HIK27531.1 peptidoglycan-binding protein [Oscillatoriaceae cyanobacterium M7585_C2015_266]
MLSYTQAKPFTIIPAEKPRLQIGSRGEAVVQLQQLLTHWGTYRGEPNGEFDKLVEAAVKRFQFAVFLKDDGIVGPLTWEALEKGAPVRTPILKMGSTGEWVTTVQTVLKEGGFYHGKIDGIFGKITDAAVRALQKSFDLVQDGVVGPRTWWALSRIPRAYLPE